MPARHRYRIALFLFLLFGGSSLLGAACTLSAAVHGWHHHGPASAAAHTHGDGRKHTHEHAGAHHDAPAKEQGKADNDCCSGKVSLLGKSDKIPAPPLVVAAAPYVSQPFPDYLSLVAPEAPRTLRTPYPFRWRWPATIPDLRIVIQSFQI